jgi:hypothetical protein
MWPASIKVGEPFSPKVAWQLPRLSIMNLSAIFSILDRTISRASSSYPQGERALSRSFKNGGGLTGEDLSAFFIKQQSILSPTNWQDSTLYFSFFLALFSI